MTETLAALVTGASRGVGRGVAAALAASGMSVFATGRSIRQTDFPDGVTTLVCDHTDDAAVADVFRRIDARGRRLGILVNVAWGGYERMVEDGRFTWLAPFGEQPTWRWDAMMTSGVRAALARDPKVARWNGRVVVAAALAVEYGFTDVDGKQPRPLTLADV